MNTLVDKKLMQSIAVGASAYVQAGVIVPDGDVNPLLDVCQLYCRDSAACGEVIQLEYQYSSIPGWRQSAVAVEVML